MPDDYSRLAKHRICRALSADEGHDLADVLDIDPRERGQGPGDVWEWLVRRGALAHLRPALQEINRHDLVWILDDDLERQAAAGPPSRARVRESADLFCQPSVGPPFDEGHGMDVAAARSELWAELQVVDLQPQDWRLVASRTTLLRERLAALVEASSQATDTRDRRIAGFAADLQRVLCQCVAGSVSAGQWRSAQELRDALIRALTITPPRG